ncbi:TerD family protein [Paludisphaera mucosa]|uniref:TerD family protein n=1 Tax=Paludisphaera mucosa TaxID=3030827 RepID=A0ABT6FID9_9BACT|nr:TerD family protein [Paludisphaera mucosa]MDG3007351.1 TerD family protein [Paludisphaera mucosa]
MNEIYVRRRSRVLIPDGSGTTPLEVLATLQKNLESLGFVLAADVIERLRTSPPHRVEQFYRRLVKDLETLVGAHRPFKPFYPGFPEQVMSASDAELYFNAIVHYTTLDRPEDEAAERPALVESTPLRVLRLGDREDFRSILATLAASKVAYSPEDVADVRWFVAQFREAIRPRLPDGFPCKENLATLAAALMRHAPGLVEVVDPHVKTATDALRVAVALSDGDVSLAEACKFGPFSRRERATLLGWVERAGNRVEDMLRWKPRWIRLGERLHPGEYAKRFPQAADAFDVLRNDRPHRSFNSLVEAGLGKGDVGAVLDFLHARPGELARRLDHLLRLGDAPDAVIATFARRAADVSTPVLLQVHAHFRRRDEPEPLRAFFPKGQVAKVYATEKTLPPLPAGVADRVAEACERALLDRFAALPPLGACYVDPRLKSYLVPFARRSASKSLRTLTRGSRLPLPDCTTLRMFVWWRNATRRVDVDLSAAMYGRDYRYIDGVTYYNLKNFAAHHSGDVVDAPHGAAEFIDVDMARCAEQGVRYVVMSLNSFSGQAYRDLPECFAGWMARSEPASGEVFEPRTVVDRVDLAADTTICLPAIFDLESREVVWADVALRRHPLFFNNVAGNLRGVSLLVRALTSLRKPDLYTLFDLHARARGEQTGDADAADSVFAVDRGLTPFDQDRIAAEFL